MALRFYDQELNGTDKKRTTEWERETEKKDLHQTAVNRKNYNTAMNP